MKHPSLKEISESSRETAQQIFDLANSYHEAAIRCFEPVSVPEKKDIVYAPRIAGVTMAAFCCELYLKSLSWEEGKKYKPIHKLDSLFNELSDEKRNSFIRRYSDIASVDQHELQKDISALGNAFVEWQYIYEIVNTVRIDKLFFIAKALYLEIREQNPEWGVVDHLNLRIMEGVDPAARELFSLGGGRYGFR